MLGTVDLVEAARSWGGQLLVLSRTKLSHDPREDGALCGSSANEDGAGFSSGPVDLFRSIREDRLEEDLQA